MSTLSLALGAFLAGLLAVPHCLAMCGGLAAGLCALIAPRPGRSALLTSLQLNLGRVAGYGLLGALAGGSGSLLYAGLDLERTALLARIASGAALMLLALAIGFPRLRLARIANDWAMTPLHHAMRRLRTASPLLLGAAWSLLPCGLSFAALLAAFSSGSAVAGLAVMAAFGLGSLFATLPASLGLHRAFATDRHRRQRRLAWLLAAAGLLGMLLPWWTPPHAGAAQVLVGPVCSVKEP